MQKALGNIFIISLLFSTNVFGQTRIKFETEEGFALKQLQVKAWTPWGIEIRPAIDTAKNEYLIFKNFNRLVVNGNGILSFDSIFQPEIVVGQYLTIVLALEEIRLEETVISISRSDSRVKNATVSISVIKPYLIENRIPTDAGQVLELVPGVNIADNQINIRNGNGWSYGAGSRVAVLVDDLPMLSPDAQTSQMSFIPLEILDGVEVVKSAGSVLYGSSALNGVINFRTIKPGNKPIIKVSAFTGFFGAGANDSLNWSSKTRFVNGSSGSYLQQIKNTAVSVSFNALNNQGYRMNEFENRGRVSLSLRQHPQNIAGLQYGINLSGQTGRSGSFLLWESYGRGYTPLDSSFNYSRSQKLAIDPFLRYSNKKFSHLLQGRTLLLDNQIDNGNPNSNQSNGSSMQFTEYRFSNAPMHKKWVLSSGLVSQFSETHSALFSGKQRARNLAAYLQTDFNFKRLKIQIGGRFEHYRLNDFKQSKPVFRAGVNYQLALYTFLRGSYGQGYRFPSMAEAFITTSTGNVYVYPNPQLKPETGDNMEVGIKQGFRIGNFKAYADFSLFNTRYTNLMEFTFAQWANFSAPLLGLGFKSVNTAQARIYGTELEIAGFGKIQRTNFILHTGYTYTIPLSTKPEEVFAFNFNNMPLTFANTRADSNNYLKYRFKHLFRMILQAERTKWEAAMSLRYASSMLNMDDAFISIVSPDIKTAWKGLGDAWIVDLRFGWKFNKQFKLNAQVQNVFNTLYFNRPADLRPPRSFQLQGVWQLL